MTTLLSKAFQKAEQLSVDIQNEIAEQLLEDLENEQKWQKTLSQPHQQLDNLAKQALEQRRQGKTKRLGIDEL